MLCLKLRYFMESQSNYNSFVRTYPPEIIKNQRILKCGGIYLCTGIYFFKLATISKINLDISTNCEEEETATTEMRCRDGSIWNDC